MNETSTSPRHVVGVMTGTSIDGIDAALVRIDGRGLNMRATLVKHVSESLGELQARLRAAANQHPMTAGEFARLAWDFGLLHAEVIARLMAGSIPPNLICVHGQTVFHQPPLSWQLVNPSPIAARFDCPVVSDLRQADLAHGGQGAPITPIADWILFRDEHRARAIINLGGFCNVTILPAVKRAGMSSAERETSWHEIRGFDVCACNQLLDAVSRAAIHQPFDEGGRTASTGRRDAEAETDLVDVLWRQASAKRSLGTGDEQTQWLERYLHRLPPADLLQTAASAVAECIFQALFADDPHDMIVAGGGAKNATLLDQIFRHSGEVPKLTSQFGVPIDAREAMCFAILGALCQDGVPITLPQVTGCVEPAPISGVWVHSKH